MSNKIRMQHLERRAFVYVRQSTSRQVLENKESTARQYALVERAHALGWSDKNIEVIDEDLGRSGSSSVDRTGFARLAKAVAHGEAGAILALEVSRVARSSHDWQRLLALCGVADVVVVDEQAIYDPRNADDKLLLDFKGTMSEVELHWLRLRLYGARKCKAERGELRLAAPTGYVWGDHGLEFDADASVRHAIATILGRYLIEPSAHAVVRWADREGILVPTRRYFSDGAQEVAWKPLGISRFKDMLKSPIYAGAYVWGRRIEEKVLVDGEVHVLRRTKQPDDWTVFLPDAHEAYISWETYLTHRDKLSAAASRCSPPSAPRDGRALLAGLLICGRCGRAMRTTYAGRGSNRWIYACYGEQDHGSKPCWTLSGKVVDGAVEEVFLRAVVPDDLELALAVDLEVEQQAGALRTQWRLRLEQAEYEARRAERRYKAVDPDNRVVAHTLEGEWEDRLNDLEGVQRQFETAKSERRASLSAEDRARVRALANDLPSVWRARTTSPADRKAMLRTVIESIALSPVDVPERRTHVRVQWRSGAVEELTVVRLGPGTSNRTSPECEALIASLVGRGLRDQDVATALQEKGQLTGSGAPWNAARVKTVRLRIGGGEARKRALPDQRADGRFSVPGAARRFGVPPCTIHRWIKRNLIEAIREDHGRHRNAWWLTIDNETVERLRAGSRLKDLS